MTAKPRQLGYTFDAHTAPLSEGSLMYRRLLAAVLIAIALTGSSHVVTAAQSRLFLICGLPDSSDLFIVIENFGGVGGAVQQCVHGWRGIPRGFERST
jgi:hypothetical protein